MTKRQHPYSRKQWITIGIHVLIWVAVFLLPYLFFYDDKGGRPNPHLIYRELNTLTKIFWLGLFYFNAFILVPRLIYPRKLFSYAVTLVSIFSVIMLAHSLLFH